MSTSKTIREKIWTKLKDVARPDTRFHMNFAEVIPDFEGSEAATDRVVQSEAYQNSRFAFITPDNCLADLRRRMIEDGKPFVMSTYGIYRGFLYLDPATVPEGAALYASWLDGMEHFGVPITLEEIAQKGRFDYLVTGASAVSVNGVRFGKGHGFLTSNGACSPILALWMNRRPCMPSFMTCSLSKSSCSHPRPIFWLIPS